MPFQIKSVVCCTVLGNAASVFGVLYPSPPSCVVPCRDIGENGEDFFLIESGTVSCTQAKSATDPNEMQLLTLETGDYFGEMALMLDEPRAANCVAVRGKVCTAALLETVLGAERVLEWGGDAWLFVVRHQFFQGLFVLECLSDYLALRWESLLCNTILSQHTIVRSI